MKLRVWGDLDSLQGWSWGSWVVNSHPPLLRPCRSLSRPPSRQVTVVQRVARLPLVRSTLQAVTAAYADAKGRLPLLRWVGGVAELGVRGLSEVAARSASPLLDRLEPQSKSGLLSHPCLTVLLQQCQALLLPLFWVQMGWQCPAPVLRATAGPGHQRRLSLSGQELELRMQMFEDDDEEEEPAVLTRVVGLLLRVGLRSYQQALLLWDQVQHAVSTLRDLADLIGLTLVAEAVSGLAQMLLTLYVAGIYRLQSLQTLARRRASELALRLAALRPVSLALSLPERARASLAVVVTDLQELGKILVQLLINTTPLYNMVSPEDRALPGILLPHPAGASSLQSPCTAARTRSCTVIRSLTQDSSPGGCRQEQPGFWIPCSGSRTLPRRRQDCRESGPASEQLKEQADQLGANRLSLEELSDGGSSRRGSCDLVLSKASEGRLARRRRQAYLEARSRRGSKQDRLPPAQPEQEPIPAATPRRRSSSTEVFLAPIIQLVSQGQRAFEYLSPGPAPVPPAVEVANQVAETAE
nr:PREDICTED: uncharacterized protein LOC107080101 [Lepisosteus oculatus]